MTTNQPFALTLADEYETGVEDALFESNGRPFKDPWVARLLRGQHAEIVQLKAEVEQLRLDKKALTNSEILDEFCVTPGIHQFISAFKAGVRFAEKHHKIGGKE